MAAAECEGPLVKEFVGVSVSRKSSLSWGETTVNRRRALLGFAAVGGFLAVDLGAVLYARGWVGDEGRFHRLRDRRDSRRAQGSLLHRR